MKKLRKRGDKIKRKYFLNEDYFDNINSEEKAYYLGFLYADGYNNEKKHEIKIRLAIKDEEWLKQFHDILYPNGDHKLTYYNNRIINGKRYSYCELYVYSKHMSQSLAKYGCIQNKTFQLKFPQIIKINNLENHFIRGVFDGDGCISMYKHKDSVHINSYSKYTFSIIGYNKFMQEIEDVLVEKLSLNNNKIIPYKGKDKRIGTLIYTGGRQCIKIREWLYNNASCYMKRKYEKFMLIGTEEWMAREQNPIKEKNIVCIERRYKKPIINCTRCGKTIPNSNKKYILDHKYYCSYCYHKINYKSNNIINKNDDYYEMIIGENKIIFNMEDYNRVIEHQWHIENNYVVTAIRIDKKHSKIIYLQRHILNLYDDYKYIRFINGNSFDCRRSNLKIVEKRVS